MPKWTGERRLIYLVELIEHYHIMYPHWTWEELLDAGKETLGQ